MTGHILGFSAIFIPKLEHRLSTFEIAAIASAPSLAQIVGALFGAIASGALGRKKSIEIFALSVCLGWALIGFSEGHVIAIVIGRAFTGFGIMTSAVQVYLSEISSPAHRGVFGASGPIAVSAGLLLVYIEGAWLFFDWRWICLFNGIVSAFVSSTTMVILPESPIWLETRGEFQRAMKSRHWLGLESEDKGQVKPHCNMLEELRKTETLKPLAIVLGLFSLVQLSGFNAILSFAVNLCKDGLELEDANGPAVAIGSPTD